MKVLYVRLVNPIARSRDQKPSKSLVMVNYTYDLELDSDFYIVGGEWHSDMHPDFLWVSEKRSLPKTAHDFLLEEDWDPTKTPLPKDWAKKGREAAISGLPGYKIVEKLIEMSTTGKKYLPYYND